jgi:NAD(P)-dependent dehydrogenase (short-subunit alcohol dehydrogenase family)
VLLEGKCAIVYGAAGAIGAAVAKAFAAEGARVALAGRSLEPLKAVMAEISEIGGDAVAANLDAYDQQEVEDHLRLLIEETGRLDISFNAVGLGYVIGLPLVEASAEDFATSVQKAMTTHFLTATAAGRHMATAGSGVILTVTASPARVHYQPREASAWSGLRSRHSAGSWPLISALRACASSVCGVPARLMPPAWTTR